MPEVEFENSPILASLEWTLKNLTYAKSLSKINYQVSKNFVDGFLCLKIHFKSVSKQVDSMSTHSVLI